VTFALDTNTLSYYMRDEGGVAARLRATSPRDIALPVIVIYEISYGLRRARRDAQLASFARMVELTTVLDFDLQAAEHAAQIRAALESAGTPIGPMDLLIAASARRHGCVLVTHNQSEFSRVPDLLVEDWY
jgi:tRNA(fMet)-specific endonuclease VapC